LPARYLPPACRATTFVLAKLVKPQYHDGGQVNEVNVKGVLMTKPSCLLLALLVFALFGCGGYAIADRLPQPALRIGVDAPPLKVMKWVKGAPVDEIKEGHIYVIEFWATWCGPCISAMPHITEIAKRYEGQATVIGVSILERMPEKTDEGILALVEPFVVEQGDKMGYLVAADGADELMTKSWFRAAGRSGIPSTFIIGKDKKIAWIGHPMAMDEALEQVVDGTWDIKAAAAEETKRWEREQDLKEVMDPVTAAFRAKDYKALVAAIDVATTKLPETVASLRPMKFDALLRTDEPAAFAFMKDLKKQSVFEENPTEAYNFWIAMNRNTATMENPDWDALIGILEEAVAAQDKSYAILVALADAYAKTSKFDRAIEMQKKAIEIAEEAGTRVPASWLERQKKQLAEYEAKQ
jgi:thiol-disulfide isomerase/thioredoxin